MSGIKYFLGHNLSLGLRAEAGDLGLTVEPRRLVAPPEGGPADILEMIRGSIGATGPPRQATGPPWSGAGVGVGILRGYHNVSWKSQRFKNLIVQKYQDSTPIKNIQT